MKFSNAFIGALLLIGVACSSSEKETPSGMKFTVAKSGDGVLPRPGQISVFDFVFLDSKDSVWNETYKQGMPAAMMIADSTAIIGEDGLLQMIRMASKGDSLIVNYAIKDFFREIAKSPIPEGLDSTLTLTYRIKINDIMDRDAYMKFQEELIAKIQAEQLKKDIQAIDEHLTTNGISAVKMESGIRYVITKPGTGATAQSGQVVKVDYAGYTLAGEYFDTSIQSVAEQKGIVNPMRKYEPYDVTIDQSSVIKGWHEALKQMNKGAKATFYIPSTLAYGPQRRGPVIKENSILVFDLEAVDITDAPVEQIPNGK
jgi:FKBP-type peptidyl-prolyl cis-trans isomerase FkpA